MSTAASRTGPARRSWRRVARGALAVAILLAFLPPLIVELQGTRAPDDAPVPGAADTIGASTVYVADWGYHTSILVAQRPGWRLGPVGREDAVASPYVEYAWGDRRFYMESRYAPWSVFATLILPTESVAYVDGWRGEALPPRGARAVYAREVDGATHWRLVAELERQLRNGAGRSSRPSPFAPAAGYGGRFYPARGAYLWWNDCNRWTVERLAAAGLARGGRGVIFSGQVARHLVGFRRVR